MPFQDIVDALLGPYGVIFLLSLFTFGHYRGWWYSGKEVERIIADKNIKILELTTDRDWHRERLFQTLNIAERLKVDAPNE